MGYKEHAGFHFFVNGCSLRNCSLQNAKFTLTNGRDPPTLSKLDKFLVSNEWELYPRFFEECIPKIVSDHWPIMLNTSKMRWGPSPLRFKNMWTTHKSFLGNVQKWWGECGEGEWEGYRFMKKLQFTKKKLI